MMKHKKAIVAVVLVTWLWLSAHTVGWDKDMPFWCVMTDYPLRSWWCSVAISMSGSGLLAHDGYGLEP